MRGLRWLRSATLLANDSLRLGRIALSKVVVITWNRGRSLQIGDFWSKMCPSCKSLNFRRLALIYNEGLSEGSIRIGRVSTRTYRLQQQTAMSWIAAPPRKWSYAKPILLWILFYCLFRLIAGAWLGPPVSAMPRSEVLIQTLFYCPILVIAAVTFWHNQWLYNEKLNNWKRQCMCQQCGTIFFL